MQSYHIRLNGVTSKMYFILGWSDLNYRLYGMDEIHFGRYIKETTIYPEKQGNRDHGTANQKRDARDQEKKKTEVSSMTLKSEVKEQILCATGGNLPQALI